IWDAFSATVGGVTPGSTIYHAESWIAFNSNNTVVANGKLVTLTVDTSGFFQGEFPLKFKDVGAEFNPNSLVATNLAGATGEVTPVTITNGTIRIVSAGSAPQVDLNGSGSGAG